MLKSIEGNFDDPEVHELLTKHFIELRAASPEGSAHVLDIPGLKVPSIKFWSLWLNDKLMGCGALKFLDKDHGEFKSIRIHDNFRGKGNGINVISHLINEAKKLNIPIIGIVDSNADPEDIDLQFAPALAIITLFIQTYIFYSILCLSFKTALVPIFSTFLYYLFYR